MMIERWRTMLLTRMRCSAADAAAVGSDCSHAVAALKLAKCAWWNLDLMDEATVLGLQVCPQQLVQIQEPE
jgi:hypothetical protein